MIKILQCSSFSLFVANLIIVKMFSSWKRDSSCHFFLVMSFLKFLLQLFLQDPLIFKFLDTLDIFHNLRIFSVIFQHFILWNPEKSKEIFPISSQNLFFINNHFSLFPLFLAFYTLKYKIYKILKYFFFLSYDFCTIFL